MSEQDSIKNLKNIKVQIEVLKQRLENIDKTLEVQEEVLDILQENSRTLLHDTLGHWKDKVSVERIMKDAMPKGKIPKILFKK